MARLPDSQAVAAIDLAGQGDSMLPARESTRQPTTDAASKPGLRRRGWSLAEHGAAIAAVIEHLGWRNVTLVGHSMGGAIAVEAASAAAGRATRIVCLDSLTYDLFYSRQDEAFVIDALTPISNDFVGYMRELAASLFVDSSKHELIEQIAAEMAAMDQGEAVAGMRALLEWDRDAAIDRCPVPIDVLAARAFLDPQVALRLGAAVTITEVDLGGHFYLREDPAGTAAAIMAVLTR